MVLDDKNAWEGILASTMFAVRAMIYTTTQHTPAQLALILNQCYDVDRENFMVVGLLYLCVSNGDFLRKLVRAILLST